MSKRDVKLFTKLIIGNCGINKHIYIVAVKQYLTCKGYEEEEEMLLY